MALSNWDTMAFNSLGKSSMGWFENDKKDAVEIYKNWICIHSPSMWHKGGSYTKPVIAELQEGRLSMCHFDIIAKRGPQRGIFVLVRWHHYIKRGKKDVYQQKFFGGIGCSGYIDMVEEVLKRLGREKDYDDNWSDASSINDDGAVHYLHNLKTGEEIVYWDTKKDGEYDYDKDWVGVKPETTEEFFKWLEELTEEDMDEELKKWIGKCRKSKKLRYNQGNAFFAANIKTGLEATAPGKAKAPVINKMIKAMKK